MTEMTRRLITKPAMASIDDIVQVILWKDYINRMKLHDGQVMGFILRSCPHSRQQMIMTVGKRGGETQECYPAVDPSDVDVAVIQDEEHTQIMMLANEFDSVEEKFKQLINS